MRKYGSLVLMLVLATFMMAPSWARAGSGFYISSDLGANFSKGVRVTGDSNDVASHCDALLNPGLVGCLDDDSSYTGNFFADWFEDFDSAQGILSGAAVGYSFGAQNPNSPLAGLRVEFEYFYRESKYDQSSVVQGISGATQDKIDRNEFVTWGPYERLGSITSHNLFGNVYYDFVNTSRFTPYIGIGGGLGITDADWNSNWTRTYDKARLRQGLIDDGRADLAMNDVYIDKLAGSSSAASTTLKDTLWGLQILFGVDYAVTEAMSLGLKGRWVKFNSFKDSVVWEPLRSHAPFVGGTADNPTNPVWGHMSTPDIEFFGISLNLKYHF